MQTIEKIRQHPLYIREYERLEKAENDRKFCRHQIPHLLDVARIAYIKNLEGNMGVSKEVIYAAALLHDIGKARQYQEGIPHELAGKEIATEILSDIPSFSEEEKTMILQAIIEHRRRSENMTALGELLFESDKQSRACYACPAERACNWGAQKKNRIIEI